MKFRTHLLSNLLATVFTMTSGAAILASAWPGTAIGADDGGGSAISAVPQSGGTVSGSIPCNRLDPISINLLEAYLLVALDLSEAQRTALAPTIGVIDEWRGALKLRCDQLNLADAPSALREISKVMTLTQSATAALVPAFEAFYTALTPEQQNLINDQLRLLYGSTP